MLYSIIQYPVVDITVDLNTSKSLKYCIYCICKFFGETQNKGMHVSVKIGVSKAPLNTRPRLGRHENIASPLVTSTKMVSRATVPYCRAFFFFF